MDNSENQEHEGHITGTMESEQYSAAMVDTIFADTLSRGMQNAITSQHNAQMASAAAITNACARILQARAAPGAKPAITPAVPTIVKDSLVSSSQIKAAERGSRDFPLKYDIDIQKSQHH